MSEYVCELPIDGMRSFVSGNVRIPVGERVTRCRDCAFFEPGVSEAAVDWCSWGEGRPMAPYDFCSLAEPRDGGRGERGDVPAPAPPRPGGGRAARLAQDRRASPRGVDPATCVPDGGGAR
ncbi:MAG: hypothetical protein MR611_04540 [Coriobacteriaceae bacterium]|nr:hypothetical protein [Coriobacteriaceae bacterium]